MLPVPQRLKFKKVGKLKFISHLDLCRTMRSAFLRAGIPIYYSEGFNPHPKMVYALTLSIGAESVCELLDIKLVEPMEPEEIKRRLNAAMTEELQILEVYEPKTKFTAVAYAEYELTFEQPVDVTPLEQTEIVVEKHTKSGSKMTDIKPEIRSYQAEGNVLRVVLNAGSENYLNPTYVADLIGGDYRILRTRVLTQELTDFV